MCRKGPCSSCLAVISPTLSRLSVAIHGRLRAKCEETPYANFEAIKKRLMRARHAEIGINEAIKFLVGRKFFTTINVVYPYQVSKDEDILIANRSSEDHILALWGSVKVVV
ncbi:hypothetical protein RvY_19204 [Ramazzottius varieornatus]|uniref:Uncharacterized protein n=1 Tax=Ramazzottius varieornatus TaxID=947166 RepID=A0A1D1W8K9_RAMVA|nr:hypothetical protein RvY_19204 [Ramazzottius varieornatus]